MGFLRIKLQNPWGEAKVVFRVSLAETQVKGAIEISRLRVLSGSAIKTGFVIFLSKPLTIIAFLIRSLWIKVVQTMLA
jgi:hypothetical protein